MIEPLVTDIENLWYPRYR